MTKRIVLSALLVALVVADANAQNRLHRRRGAILGGLAGAAVGVAIGDKGNNETAGALIGGAVGAVAGGAIGNQKDRRIEEQHQHAYQSQQYRRQLSDQQAHAHWQAQQLAQQQAARALTSDDVVTMVRRGLSEPTIIQYIQVNGVRHRLNVNDIISLHEQGVSEPIINALQTAPVIYADPQPQMVGPENYRVEVPTYHSAPGVINQRVIVDPHQGYGPSVIVPQYRSHHSPPAPPQPWGLSPAR